MIRRSAFLAAAGAYTLTASHLPPALAESSPVPDAELVAKATAEGSVTVYVALASGDIQKLTERFASVYPAIKLQTLRLESDQVPAKLTIEQRGGVYNADVEMAPGFQTDQLKRSGAIIPYRCPEMSGYGAGSVDRDGYWTACLINTDTIAYNTERLAAYGLKAPTGWSDFVKPEWRGRFVLFNGSYEWFASMHRALGNAAADRLMAGLAANNPHMVGSHQLAIDQMAAGEYAAALNVYGYNAARYKHQGRPVQLLNAEPVIGEIECVALVKNGPHPNAGRLYIRWLLSRETQAWMVTSAGIGRISGRTDVASNPEIWSPKLKITVTNPAESVNYAQEVRAFNTTFGITQ